MALTPTVTFFSRIKTFLLAHWIVSVVVAILLVGGAWYFFGSTKAAPQFVTVTRGSITQTVSVTGNTTPKKSVSLGFQNTGTIARVNYNLGDLVSAGSVIAELNMGNLFAALQQSEANLTAAKANLAALEAGTRPEQLAIDESSVMQGQAALANSIANAYAVSDSAIHTNADQFFINDSEAYPHLPQKVDNITAGYRFILDVRQQEIGFCSVV